MSLEEHSQEIYEDCNEVSHERLDRGRERLNALESQMLVGRKERFQRGKKLSQELTQLSRSEAELQKELDKERRQQESRQSIETRMGQKLQEICDGLDTQVAPGAVREAARLNRLESQLEDLGNLLSSSELPSYANALIIKSFPAHDDGEVEPFRSAVSDACSLLARREAEHAEAATQATLLKEELASVLLRQVKADLAQLDAALPASSSDAGPPSTEEADELRHLQDLQKELSRRLEHEASVPTARAVPAAVSAPVATPAATPAGSPRTSMAAPAQQLMVATLGIGVSSTPVATVVAAAAASSADGASAAAAVLPVSAGAPTAKGKGKGKGKAPPPPSGKAPPPPGAGINGSLSVLKKSNLINLHWKVIKDPPPTEPSSKDNGFSAKTSQIAAAFTPAATAEETSQTRILAIEASRRAERRQELRLPPEVCDDTVPPVQRDTVFEKPMKDVKVMTTPLLEVYFKARTTSIKMPSGDGTDANGNSGEAKPALIDKKQLQGLGICITKYIMSNKGMTEDAALMSLKRAVLRCDYDVARQEALALFYTVLRKHREEGSQVSKLVDEKGEAALLQLEQSAYHRMVHELLKVPQIEERLECMLFQTDFDSGLRKCRKQLDVLKQALDALDRKRDLLGKFFSTALRMGQSLNRDSRAPAAPRGFQLASLEKLAQTKSTKSPKHSVLHFVLALMEPEDVEQLFTNEDRLKLSKAKSMKSYTVYQECIDLVQGFYGLREICETGTYKDKKMLRRRKTMAPGMRPRADDDAADSGKEKENEAPIDGDDRFHDTMQAFVDDNFSLARGIAKEVLEVFSVYKDLALFFDDLDSVWPPPRDEKDAKKVDLVAVFRSLGENVRVCRQDVEQDGLRALINPPPPPAAEPDSVEVDPTSAIRRHADILDESDLLPQQGPPERSPAFQPAERPQVQGRNSLSNDAHMWAS